jgi:hypothetical protein
VKHFKIAEPTLRKLLTYGHLYQALINYGVHNWEGYGYAIKEYLNDCLVTDEFLYDSIEDIVEIDLANFEVLI